MAIIGNSDAAPEQQQQPDGGELIKDSDTANFAADVIDMSMRVPVIVDFWAPWCGPCKQLTPILEKLVRHGAGLVRLVKINIDDNQQLAQQLQIQSIPAVFAFKDGRPADAFMGALPESEVKAFIERLTKGAKAPIDMALDEAAAALDAGAPDAAAQLYGQVLSEEGENAVAIGGLLRCALALGDLAQAREMIGGLTDAIKRTPEVAAAITAVELAEAGDATTDTGALEARLGANENDHEARLELAVALYAGGQSEAAVEHLLELVRRDRAWNEEAARKQLVKIFEALGFSHPMSVEGRKKLSIILFS